MRGKGIRLDLSLLLEGLRVRFVSQKKKRAIFCSILILLLLFIMVIIPYARVEVLTLATKNELLHTDLSSLNNIYGSGIPELYDIKVYSYHHKSNAKAMFVVGDCEFGLMVDLTWDENAQWIIQDHEVMWTVHGGSAGEWFWPYYCWRKEVFFAF